MTDKIKKTKPYPVHKTPASRVTEYATDYLPALKTGFRDFIYSDVDMLALIKKGISKRALDTTLEMMGISLEEMSEILQVSPRTIRRYTSTSLLNTKQSERILELTKLYHYGEEVFGNLETFKAWMNSHVLALGQQKPKEFLDTSIGIKLITNMLGRIEYGVYS